MTPTTVRPRYEKLLAWQASHKLAVLVYRLTPLMPAEERYGLCAQMRRAASSISSNLVEGSMRHGKAEYRRFVAMAAGSFNELRYHVQLCRDLGYLPPDKLDELGALVDDAGRLVWGLYRGLGGVVARKT